MVPSMEIRSFDLYLLRNADCTIFNKSSIRSCGLCRFWIGACASHKCLNSSKIVVNCLLYCFQIDIIFSRIIISNLFRHNYDVLHHMSTEKSFFSPLSLMVWNDTIIFHKVSVVALESWESPECIHGGWFCPLEHAIVIMVLVGLSFWHMA